MLNKKLRRPQLEILEDRLAPANHIWSGFGATDLWSDINNWQGKSAPTPGESNVTLEFSNLLVQPNSTNNLTNLSVTSITFYGSGYVLRGAPITFAGDTTVTDKAAGTNVIAFRLLQEPVSFGDFSFFDHVFDVAAGATLQITGKITGAPVLNSVHKVGPGALILSNPDNDYGGATEVDAGILQGAAGAIPPTSPVSVSPGAQLALTNPTLGSLSGSGDVSIAGGNFRVGADNTSTTFSGVISGAGGLIKVGTGTFTLAAVNKWTGPTTVLAGTLAQGIDNAAPPNPCTVATGATFDLGGFDAALGSLAGGGTVSAVPQPIRTLTTGLDDTSTSFAGVIQGGLNLIKVGGGTFTLSGADKMTGSTPIAAGGLRVNGSLPPASVVTVAGSATLGGSGSVGPVTVNDLGTVSPGNSPGILTTQDINFNSGSVYRVELNGTRAGSDYDQLDVQGTADLTDHPTLSASLGYDPHPGDELTILVSTDRVIGNFKDLPPGALVHIHEAAFRIHYTDNSVFLTFSRGDDDPDLRRSAAPGAGQVLLGAAVGTPLRGAKTLAGEWIASESTLVPQADAPGSQPDAATVDAFFASKNRDGVLSGLPLGRRSLLAGGMDDGFLWDAPFGDGVFDKAS
jgi:autotransporter-associated beta strand protein